MNFKKAAKDLFDSRPDLSGQLRPYQLPIARMTIEGLSSHQIAAATGSTQHAVQQAQWRIRNTLGVSGPAQLVLLFMTPPKK